MTLAEIFKYITTGWRLPVLLTLVLVILVLIFWAYCEPNPIKENPLINNMGIDNGKIQVINKLVDNQQREVNNAANNTQTSVNDLHNSINRPSNQYSNNGAAVNDRFCRDFPSDPSCH
jgi:hypothetical protein